MTTALRSDELIVDSFAGGGGASLGMSWALGRHPDIPINHDKEACALYEANHGVRPYREDVWAVNPVVACAGRPVGLMWLSPDCKHFSKAKGGKPVDKKVRGLAWVAVRWAKAVAPRIIVLENVEEFQTWGPLLPNGKPCPARKGLTFRRFVGRLRTLGYHVEWRELRACDFGAPTTRKRLFLIARRDGQPIRWPLPTHGKGTAQPWRTAAECIDWSLECPSIFLTTEEAKAIGVRRPLADATLRRIARGVQRYVIDAADPFIVSYYGAKRDGDDRIADIGSPLPTQTTENRFAVVQPFIAGVGGRMGQSAERSVDRPYQTITAKGDAALVVPTLIQTGYGEDKKRNGGLGQPPRALDIHQPLGTVVAQGAKHALVAAFMAQNNTGEVGHPIERPVSTIVGKGCTQSLVTAHLQRDFGKSVGSAVSEPVPTITGGGGGHAAVVASSLVKLKGTARDGQQLTLPLHTVQAGGLHYAEVRAFLVAYYGNEKDGGSLRAPMRTVTSKDRLGLVTVHGEEYAIADIGMRMLAPRELYRAQGFPDSYRIDIEYKGKPLSKTAQVRMCGNSVCPPLAAAIVRANLGSADVGEVAA